MYFMPMHQAILERSVCAFAQPDQSFAMHTEDSQRPSVYQENADAQADLNLPCVHMSYMYAYET